MIAPGRDRYRLSAVIRRPSGETLRGPVDGHRGRWALEIDSPGGLGDEGTFFRRYNCRGGIGLMRSAPCRLAEPLDFETCILVDVAPVIAPRLICVFIHCEMLLTCWEYRRVEMKWKCVISNKLSLYVYL